MTAAPSADPASAPPRPRKRLIASIHDVGPRFERHVDRLVELLSRRLGGPNFAMLVVPDHWGEAPLSAAPAYQRRLREWSDAGVEMFVHGWLHRDTSEHSGMAAIKARHMTASEGEFLGLSHADAARRMREGRELIEGAIGRPVAGFIAPAWLYGEGARAALRESGFALAEDHMRVWRPSDEAVLAKGPVITWASRSAPRRLSSRMVAAAARVASSPLDVLRIAVHPGDTTRPELMASIDATFAACARGRTISRYADLLADASAERLAA